MRKFRRIVLAFLLLFATFHIVQPAEQAVACSCVSPGNAEEAKEQSSAVFTGTVTGIEEFKADRQEMYNAATLTVHESWKGVREAEQVVYTSWSSCMFDFEQGKTYLLYAYEHEGRYEVINCGRSGEVIQANERAMDDLKLLGDGTKFEAATNIEQPKEDETGTLILGIGISVVALLLIAAGFVWKMRKRKG